MRTFNLVAMALLLTATAIARADVSPVAAPGTQIPQIYRNVGVVEHLNRQLPLDARLYDEDGQYVTLRQILQPGRPLLLQLGYLECPMLCDTISRDLMDSAKSLDLSIGKDFDYVFISIDPTDTPTLATLKRNSYIAEYDRAGSQDGIHVLVAKPNEIALFSNTVGFGYQPTQNGQFAHPAVAMVITPDGRISKYLYPGPQHPWFPGDVMKSALSDASQGKFSTSVDALLLICLQYTKSAYSRASMNLMRVSGILTMMILGSAIFWMVKRGSHAQQMSIDHPSDGGKN